MFFPENRLTKNRVWTTKTCPGGGTTTFGGETAISAGGMPNTGGTTASRSVLAEFNHCIRHFIWRISSDLRSFEIRFEFESNFRFGIRFVVMIWFEIF